MSSLFISGIPRTANVDEVESFLRQQFPSCTDIVLLRSDPATHKGHAYVHFGSTVDARAALSTYSGDGRTLHYGSDAAPLRIRLSNASREGQRPSPLEGAPLPARYMDHSFSQCAFFDDGGDTGCQALLDQVEAVLLPLMSPALCTVPRVALFATHTARDAAVSQHPVHFARCAPPRLSDLVCSSVGVGDGSSPPRPDRKRRREGSRSPLRHEPWSAEVDGLKPLSPAEALQQVADFFEHSNRVAFTDATGAIALLRLPSHAAGFL